MASASFADVKPPSKLDDTVEITISSPPDAPLPGLSARYHFAFDTTNEWDKFITENMGKVLKVSEFVDTFYDTKDKFCRKHRIWLRDRDGIKNTRIVLVDQGSFLVTLDVAPENINILPDDSETEAFFSIFTIRFVYENDIAVDCCMLDDEKWYVVGHKAITSGTVNVTFPVANPKTLEAMKTDLENFKHDNFDHESILPCKPHFDELPTVLRKAVDDYRANAISKMDEIMQTNTYQAPTDDIDDDNLPSDFVKEYGSFAKEHLGEWIVYTKDKRHFFATKVEAMSKAREYQDQRVPSICQKITTSIVRPSSHIFMASMKVPLANNHCSVQLTLANIKSLRSHSS